MNTLEDIIDAILKHDKEHPDHGIGCACHDQHAASIRRLLSERGLYKPGHAKSLGNLNVVFNYIMRTL